MSTPSDFHENGGWKIRCPRSPAKKSPLGRSAPRAARNRNWATLTSCASSTTTKSKGGCLRLAKCGGQAAEQARRA